MALSDTHEEQIVRVLDRLLLFGTRARRSVLTRLDQALHARSLGADHVLIVHRGREHGDGGAVRLVREVRADDHRFLRGQPARQLAGGSRKRVGLEAEILTRELGAASKGRGQCQHLAQPIHERQLLKGERERSLDLHRHVDGGLDIELVELLGLDRLRGDRQLDRLELELGVIGAVGLGEDPARLSKSDPASKDNQQRSMRTRSRAWA